MENFKLNGFAELSTEEMYATDGGLKFWLLLPIIKPIIPTPIFPIRYLR